MKIISKKYGIIHAYAQCDSCEWDATIDIEKTNRMQKLRNEIYKHIRETGHKVILDTGNTTIYCAEDK